MSAIDTHQPGEKWEFNEEVANVFEDMLKRSIPQYSVMRDLVFTLGTTFVKPNTDILDLGASIGSAVQPFIRRFGAYNRFVLVEVAEGMRMKLQERYKDYTESGVVSIRDWDLREKNFTNLVKPSLTLSILTMQFIPVEHRLQLFHQVYKTLQPGGAFILVEKVLGRGADLNALFVKRYYDLKKANGYTEEDITRKRLALEGVLVPMGAKANEDYLRDAGFREIDCFWRWVNFAGWVAVK
jgi:tRNA (cmo5U34)-methyltransferase